MLIVKTTKNSAAGAMPGGELIRAGMLQAVEHLHPSVKCRRIDFSGGVHRIVDGPCAETKGLIAGLWISKVTSIEEAVEWARRCRAPMPAQSAELEIRLMFEAGDRHEGHGENCRRLSANTMSS